MSMADLSRRQLRELMRAENLREDGTRYTQPDAERRRKRNRDKNAAARAARKKSR